MVLFIMQDCLDSSHIKDGFNGSLICDVASRGKCPCAVQYSLRNFFTLGSVMYIPHSPTISQIVIHPPIAT